MAKPSGLVVNRWTKGDHDRLYVNTPGPNGRKVGWYDLRTRKTWVGNPDERHAFGLALQEWQAGTAQRRGPGPRRRGAAAEGGGLVDNKPGEALLDIAEQRQIRNRGLRIAARVLGIRTADTAWKVGAKGERRVGRRLAKLEKHGWRVLHNLQLPGGGDVDHVVIGPGGVWAVNAKRHKGAVVAIKSGKVQVKGWKHDYPGQAHREAERVTEVLFKRLHRPVNVAPMIVIDGAVQVRGWVWRRPRGVPVLPLRWARWWFRLPGRAVLTPADVDELHAVLRPMAQRRVTRA